MSRSVTLLLRGRLGTERVRTGTRVACEEMQRDMLSMDRDGTLTQQVLVNLANCTSRQAASAASASQPCHQCQLVGVQQFKQALAIICWVLGLPGK